MKPEIYNQFKNSHQDGIHKFLQPVADPKTKSTVYTVVDNLPESISEYAYHRLLELKQTLDTSQEKKIYADTAELIYSDYKIDSSHRNWLEKALDTVLCLLRIRTSAESIEHVYQSIQIDSQITLGQSLRPNGDLSERQKRHREPLQTDYGKVALSKGPYTKALNDKLANHEELET